MGICRDSRHKRRHTGGKRKSIKKKRKFELGRPMASTKLGAKRIHLIRTRGGNEKRRAMRVEQGNFSWGTEVPTHKTRILDVVYNASDNDLVRTKTLVKNAIVQIDATPFKLYYIKHYGLVNDFFNATKGDKKTDSKLRTAQGRGRPSEESTPSVNTESLAPNLRTSSDRVASLHVSLPALDKVVVQMATFWRGQSLLSTRGNSSRRSKQ